MEYINELRAKHGSPEVVQDENLVLVATKYSELLNNLGKTDNSQSSIYSECIRIIKNNTETDPQKILKETIDLWYNEIRYYNFINPSYNIRVKNFINLIWKQSNIAGIGITFSSDKSVVAIVLNMYPKSKTIKSLLIENVRSII